LKTTTKPKGMMFTAESVRAFLEGRKSQTRRLIKGPWILDGDESGCGYDPPKTPYPVGSVVYAKEIWSPDHAAFYPNFPVVYKADYHLEIEGGKVFSPETNDYHPFRWRSPLHMPRWAARLWFRVTDVRVQRLCDISEEDAKAEGVTFGLIKELIESTANRLKSEPEYWIYEDCTESYCRKHAEAKLAKLRKKGSDFTLCGGYGNEESDTSKNCEKCGIRLDCCLTNYGAERELEYLESEKDTTTPEFCYSFRDVIYSQAEDGPLAGRILKLGYRVIWDRINPKTPWESNPWVWCYTLARIEKPEGV
jgi:hypothetical protein